MSSQSLRWLSLLSVGLLAPAWWLASQHTNFIANPIEVMQALPEFLANRETWVQVAYTLWRVLAGLLLGILLGTVGAFVMYRGKLANDVASTFVTIGLRTPSAVAAFMALAIFRGHELGYVSVVAFITFPYIAIGLLEGLKSTDAELREMSQIYHLSRWQQIRHVLIPFVAPYIFSSLRNAHALAWKVIVAVEIFGAAKNGLGAKFSYAWAYFLKVDIHLWLLVFMALVLFAEYVVLRTFERKVFRWRDAL